MYELGKSSLDAKIIELKKHDKELDKQIKQIENSTTEKFTKQKELNELKEERAKSKNIPVSAKNLNNMYSLSSTPLPTSNQKMV